MQKYAPAEVDFDEYTPSLSVEDICFIASIWNDNIDMSEDTIPSKIIKICINTLNSDHMTPEQESLGHFTQTKLKKTCNMVEMLRHRNKSFQTILCSRDVWWSHWCGNFAWISSSTSRGYRRKNIISKNPFFC